MQAEEVRIDARNGSGHWVNIKTSTVYDSFSLTLRFLCRVHPHGLQGVRVTCAAVDTRSTGSCAPLQPAGLVQEYGNLVLQLNFTFGLRSRASLRVLD